MKDKPKTGAAFTEKPLSVVRDSLDSTETATVRYYEDLLAKALFTRCYRMLSDVIS